MIKEFKEFVMRGNVLDLAVGIIIGAAFTAVVTSFVDDILMPPIGMALGGVDFSNLYVSLDGVQLGYVRSEKEVKEGEVSLRDAHVVTSRRADLVAVPRADLIVAHFNVRDQRPL